MCHEVQGNPVWSEEEPDPEARTSHARCGGKNGEDMHPHAVGALGRVVAVQQGEPAVRL